ncbi:MAG: hypothetical protein JXO22_02830 [Phycisphaerae bacterium]|nr:hypothetical protein [Phycisphaerae bacterium]
MTTSAGMRPSRADSGVRFSCLMLGAALAVWGVAPALMHRLITGQTPTLGVLGFGSASLAIGAMYLGLYLLIRQGARYAVWLALILGALLLLADLGLWMTLGARYVSGFVLLLAGAVVATAVLTLVAPDATGSTTTLGDRSA